MHAAAPITESTLDFRFPPLPRTVGDVARLLRSGERNPDRLAILVERDPMMAAAVLRRVNSAYFGVRHQVADPRKAILMLGFEDVCNLVLTTAFVRLEQVVEDRESRRVFGDLVQLSLGAALFSDLIAREAKLALSDAAFSSGLLHACGRLVLLQHFGAAYSGLCDHGSATPFPSASIELSRFDIDHTRIGSAALHHWNLPTLLARIVGALEAPGRLEDPDERALGLAVSVAISATRQLCLTPEKDRNPFRARAALHVLARGSGVPSVQISEAIANAGDGIRENLVNLAREIGLQ